MKGALMQTQNKAFHYLFGQEFQVLYLADILKT